MTEELLVLKAQWFDVEMQIRNAVQARNEIEKKIIAIYEAPAPVAGDVVTSQVID